MPVYDFPGRPWLENPIYLKLCIWKKATLILLLPKQIQFEKLDEKDPYVVGEKRVCRFNGGKIGWWNWGTKEVRPSDKASNCRSFSSQPTICLGPQRNKNWISRDKSLQEIEDHCSCV
jgi:hypothetical protein